MMKIIKEETKFKRISSYKEFDNGHVLHNDWKEMSSEDAENIAKQKSIDDPDNIYYVAYDDVMDPSSDLRWINGKSYDYSQVQMRGDKPVIKGKSMKVLEANIEAENPGILEVPEGKGVQDLPVSHFKKLIDKKGRTSIIRALTNLEVWNKNDDKKLSNWAKSMKKSIGDYGVK